ncbi:MAG: hypothetical protein GVY24_05745 [Planctomycetes bacterium]|jgi:hypothetical protein|nr:hypothetical protein [Planctomycetota bacterium]
MPSRSVARCIPRLGLVLLLTGAAAVGAAAQIERLDRSQFIRGLAERNMGELLGHYLGRVGDELEAIERINLTVQQKLMVFRNADPTDNESWEKGRDALSEAIAIRQQLIADNPEHNLRPVWQTDLAELLMIEQMGRAGQHAELYYEFGVPTREQKQLFESAALDALQATAQASEGFYALQGLMGRRPEIKRELEEAALMQEIDTYREARTPFFLAHASYYVSLLPDEHPYFTSITAGEPGPIDLPARANSIERERERLLNDALDRIEPFATDTSDPYGIRQRAMSLAGRVQIARGEVVDGTDRFLAPVIADDSFRQNTFHLAASLGQVFGVARRQEFGLASDLLVELENHPLVEQSVLFRLLIADAAHRVMLRDIETRPSEQQQQMLAAAYTPYLEMLDALPAEDRQRMEVYIYNRWVETIPDDADLSEYPPMVRMAVTELEMQRGLAAKGAASPDEPGKAEEAREHFARAIEAGQTLTDPSLPEAERARGMYALAVAIAQREELSEDGQSSGAILRVIDLGTDIADQMPNQPVAERAIALAISYAQQLHRAQEERGQPISGVDSAYQRAAEVLFSKYDGTQTADEQRVYYAQVMLQAKGDYLEAAQMYARVPFNSSEYFLAQSERLFCLRSIWEQAESASDKELARQRVQGAAESLAEEAQRVATQSQDPVRLREANTAAAASKIVRADLAIAAQNTDAAMALLEGFAEQHENDPYYTPLALERRIMALVEAKRLDEAAAEARRMMDQWPGQAAGIVSDVLTDLESEIDDLTRRAEQEVVEDRRRDLLERRQQKASVAVKLAEVLLDWAQGQGMPADQMLPYRLPLIKSLRLSGEAERALEMIAPLAKDNPNDATVLLEHAEALYAVGGEENLKAARRIFIRLIQGLGRSRPLPPAYWRSWVRALSIADRLGEGTEKIPGRVRQLRATVDDSLGGPEFRPQLEELEAKYAAQ